MRMYNYRKIACALFLACAGSSVHAVSLSPEGSGQVLLYPSYVVDDTRQTQISINNDEDRGKALRIVFRESENSREVLSFNIYLAPHDSWTAAIFGIGATGPANLLTDDTSCTFPDIRGNTILPQLADGRHYVSFRDVMYIGSNQDAGSTTMERTRAGSLEVYEMGSIEPGSPLEAALTLDANGNPQNCGYLKQAWSLSGGVWNSDPTHGLRNPTGGLRGNASVVDVSAGRLFGYDAGALQDFRVDPTDVPRGTSASVVLHTPSGSIHPSLDDALSDAALKVAAADLRRGGAPMHVEYPAGRAIDAVSAVLMTDSLRNDYIVDANAGATTRWIMSMPTRRFYTDEAIVGTSAIAPFTRVFPKKGDSGASCLTLGYQAYERTGKGNSPAQATHKVCGAVSEMPITAADFSGAGNAAGFSAAGWQRWDLSGESATSSFAMRPANDGTVFKGLPVLGFAEINFGAINAKGTPANYSSRSAHRTTVRCTNAAGKCD